MCYKYYYILDIWLDVEINVDLGKVSAKIVKSSIFSFGEWANVYMNDINQTKPNSERMI